MKKLAAFATVFALSLPLAAQADEGLGDAAAGNKTVQSGKVMRHGARHAQGLKKAKQLEGRAKRAKAHGELLKNAGHSESFAGKVRGNKTTAKRGRANIKKGSKMVKSADQAQKSVDKARGKAKKQVHKKAGVKKGG